MTRYSMAFYNPTYYHDDFSEYDSNATAYDNYYDSAQSEPFMTHSSYEPSFHNLFDYPPPPRYFGEAYDSGTANSCSPTIFSDAQLNEYDPIYRGAYDSAISYSANACSASNFSEFQVIEYDPCYLGAYGSAISYSANACSASTFSVPKVIEYDPNYCGENYQKVSTQFVISYAVSEFNEPDFEEYDPTPYGGGYDIAQTYGKPLPPSNEICYPLSSSSSLAPKAPLNDASSKGSTELQNGKEEKAKEGGKERIAEKSEEGAKERIEEKVQPSDGNKPTQIHKDNDDSTSESDSASEGEEIGESNGGAWPDLGSGYENGRGTERDNDYERAINQFPSGYGLEAMDLCETLFGYWPCLSRIKKQTGCRHATTCEDWHGNQWQTAADYLFGSYNPYPDGQTRDGRGQG